jgi:hypothetical protein
MHIFTHTQTYTEDADVAAKLHNCIQKVSGSDLGQAVSSGCSYFVGFLSQ